MRNSIFAALDTLDRMSRSKLIAGMMILLAAAIMATASPAFAHGAHKQAPASSQERITTFAERSAEFEAGLEAIRGLTPPAGDMWLAPASNPAGGSDNCHSASICCMNHCSVGNALTAKSVDQPSVINAARVDLAMAEQPDDAPLQTRLRPPCR